MAVWVGVYFNVFYIFIISFEMFVVKLLNKNLNFQHVPVFKRFCCYFSFLLVATLFTFFVFVVVDAITWDCLKLKTCQRRLLFTSAQWTNKYLYFLTLPFIFTIIFFFCSSLTLIFSLKCAPFSSNDALVNTQQQQPVISVIMGERKKISYRRKNIWNWKKLF